MIKKSNKINKILNLSFLFVLSFYFSVNKLNPAHGQTAIPREVIELIASIDIANNNKDIETLQEFISPQFTNPDGLNNESLLQSIKKLWQKYPNLRYTTVIDSTEQNNEQLIVNITTQIEGSYNDGTMTFNLASEVSSRQVFENNQLISQEIIREKTRVTSGENPPQITVQLPEKARFGQQFDFDAIVDEPIDNNLLLGGVREDRVNSTLFLNPEPLDLDALTAGGIFKRVTMGSGDRWYSAVFIRDDGMTLITQRVREE